MSTKGHCEECDRLRAKVSELAEMLTIDMHLRKVFKLRPTETEVLSMLLRMERCYDSELSAILPFAISGELTGVLAGLRRTLETYGVGILRLFDTHPAKRGYYIPDIGKRFIKDIVLEYIAGQMGARVKRTPKKLRPVGDDAGKRPRPRPNSVPVVPGMHDPLARALISANYLPNMVPPHDNDTNSRAAGRTSPPRPVAG